MFNRKQKQQAEELKAKLAAMSAPATPAPLPPPEPRRGPITRGLVLKRSELLVDMAAMNAELDQLERQIVWFERNQIAEEMFVKVAKILDSLRAKNPEKGLDTISQ